MGAVAAVTVGVAKEERTVGALEVVVECEAASEVAEATGTEAAPRWRVLQTSGCGQPKSST